MNDIIAFLSILETKQMTIQNQDFTHQTSVLPCHSAIQQEIIPKAANLQRLSLLLLLIRRGL